MKLVAIAPFFCGLLFCCKPTHRIEFIKLGSLTRNSMKTRVEFVIPDHKGSLFAISGHLISEDYDYQDFLSSYRFDVRCVYKGGVVKVFENLTPREANWHGYPGSFVILSEFDESKDGKAIKVAIRVIPKDTVNSSVEENISIEIFGGIIEDK